MKDQAALEEFVNDVIQTEGLDVGIDAKVALLSYAMDELQRSRSVKKPPVRFEEYVQCERFADLGTLWFTAPKHFEDNGTGTAPIRLQAPLLLFLLIHHHQKRPVFDLIGRFIDKVTPRLKPLDFKKTKTGVTRCHTNTRFAANVLRKYGLLKYTQREAFKTWELSIAGSTNVA